MSKVTPQLDAAAEAVEAKGIVVSSGYADRAIDGSSFPETSRLDAQRAVREALRHQSD